jgi:hypothetical protein
VASSGGGEVRGSRSIEEEPHQGQRSSRKLTHQRCFDEIPVGNDESDDEVGQMASLENKEGVGCFSERKKLCAEQSRGEHQWQLYAEGERGMEGGRVLYAIARKRWGRSGTGAARREEGGPWVRHQAAVVHARQWPDGGAHEQCGAGDRVP